MATALGVFGNQLGVGLGFLVPPLLVPDPQNISDDHEKMEEMKKGWYEEIRTNEIEFNDTNNNMRRKYRTMGWN